MSNLSPAETLSLHLLEGSFITALGVFCLGAVVRAVRGRGHVEEPLPEMVDGAGPPPLPVSLAPSGGAVFPYAAPGSLEPAPPPPLAGPGIATWFYQRSDLLCMAAIFLFFLWVTVSGAEHPTPAAEEKKTETAVLIAGLIVSVAIQFIFAGGVVMAVWNRRKPAAWLGLRWRKWPWVMVIAPVTVLAMWAVMISLQASGYNKWLQDLTGDRPQEAVRIMQEASDPIVLALIAFAAVIVAPICEETVFRGYLYPAAKRFAGPGPAAFFSALVFAAAHGNVPNLLPLFLLGLALVFVYEKTGSLWAPMAVHFCFNGASVTLMLAARWLKLPLDSGV